MSVAILGWGSLINEPRGLPVQGEWQPDGPRLKVEFSRISRLGDRAGCLTLVIDERCPSDVTTQYILSSRNDLAHAIADLRAREGTSEDDIGFWDSASGRIAPKALSRHPDACKRISSWALKKQFYGVVWTALGPRFKDVLGIPFDPGSALSYLNSLDTPVKEKALAYISAVPSQTMTPFRRHLIRNHE